MKKILILISILFLSLPVHAVKLTSGDYELDLNPSTSGGGELEGGGYTLLDNKAEPVIGVGWLCNADKIGSIKIIDGKS